MKRNSIVVLYYPIVLDVNMKRHRRRWPTKIVCVGCVIGHCSKAVILIIIHNFFKTLHDTILGLGRT